MGYAYPGLGDIYLVPFSSYIVLALNLAYVSSAYLWPFD